MDMRAGRMAMGFLVATDGNFRRMRMHGRIRKHEGDVFRTLAALAEIVKLEAGQIGDEIRLPKIELRLAVAAHDFQMLALALELIGRAGALGEFAGIVKDEIFIVIEIER